ncbi:MAG: 2-isopropylmalate synthase, partial [Deferribacteraceae bacterium]|nr:2-isopropylmalate synthase [Deferribacteraceae bacterium]
MSTERYIKFFDTTLRDGEQSPSFSMKREDKLAMALQLEKLGVDVIEAGFPASSPEDFESVADIANSIKSSIVAGLARANRSDIETAWSALKGAAKPRIHVFIAT